jgi:hypothetical protein
MKIGRLKISPAGRVVAFFIGVVSAWVTLKAISRGAIRIGGVEHARADGPVDFWFVIAVMIYSTVLLFCAALVRRKTDA